ncbi:MAG: hypothetical protein KZQ66_00150, partial [Candidatus Thiodiazotropha sp. (ex Lucinoma aequizonata)]|nr:hypothetical protein [Candidatus Thiodiazotropha sp. (ex Lucinoma aequizonata)]MCU7889548.1 hypothetical protein [Candidatus Thiodiazotropha sp. (ex Lucinoma aequizonata)]MCU7894513.1 hypothetical protein [Candidatus Thiodiazotropha sp. (ex Lucinoma aequizonata)]MCU7900621.1 hypothetical protein [Candidatus Thiodiazotropha sp. (ex Lucinoma aequizonata)]MCU7910374.1 hypothetical protein [Candidatus Thiodiazotropha sp. (ex Lucinoma aequizonata)]
LALAKERVRLLPFGWHPGTQLLGAHLNSYYFLRVAIFSTSVKSTVLNQGVHVYWTTPRGYKVSVRARRQVT